VDLPELHRIFIMDVGGSHTYRVIYMDGRPHPKDLAPSYYGHSTGRWEGDTLVVDTVGFNERFWLSRGLPSTEQLHMIERVTRTNFNTPGEQFCPDLMLGIHDSMDRRTLIVP
jgi:hypothetical protein